MGYNELPLYFNKFEEQHPMLEVVKHVHRGAVMGCFLLHIIGDDDWENLIVYR